MSDTPESPSDKPAPTPLFDTSLAKAVQQSAQDIWLAGMGAFAKAHEEGGKMFEALVREGVELQRRTHAAAEERIVEASSRIGGMASQVTTQAGQQWDRLESIFEDRVAKSLNRLGMPSAKDVDALRERLEALDAHVAELARALAERELVGQAPVSAVPAIEASSGEAEGDETKTEAMRRPRQRAG